jgi:hypothetical protein
MRAIFVVALNFLLTLASLNMALGADARDLQSQGMGHVHMDISCSRSVSKNFDTGLALLHNFWYPRAFSTFEQVIQADPECAIAYWGAAMTYNHPFWDPPTEADEQSAWALVQKGMKATEKSPREQMYLDAISASRVHRKA